MTTLSQYLSTVPYSLLNALGTIDSRYGHAGHLFVEADPFPTVDAGLAVQVSHTGGAGLEESRERVQQCLDLHWLGRGSDVLCVSTGV